MGSTRTILGSTRKVLMLPIPNMFKALLLIGIDFLFDNQANAIPF